MWSSGQHQFVELSGIAVARLIKANAAINQGVVDDDLFTQDGLAIVQDHQVGPPAFGGAVSIVFLASAVTPNRKTQLAFAAILRLHLAGLLPAVQRNERSPSV